MWRCLYFHNGDSGNGDGDDGRDVDGDVGGGGGVYANGDGNGDIGGDINGIGDGGSNDDRGAACVRAYMSVSWYVMINAAHGCDEDVSRA